jgi:3-oxoacyl-(acyl-carrier-protein) synthase
VVAAVRAMVHGVIPPAKNFDQPAEGCRLNVITKRREGPLGHALCCSYTFGGQTAALVLKAFEEDATK